MKKFLSVLAAVLLLLMAPCAAWAQTAGTTYYVSAAGNDKNNGLSEAAAFKTLGNAVRATRFSGIKTITVIGTLNQASEGGDDDYVFTIVFTSGEILITGVPNASGSRRAVLSAAGTQKNGVGVGGLEGISVRFEHIEISGSAKTGLQVGLNAEVTLREGAAVRNNADSGVWIPGVREDARDRHNSGHLILDGGIVEGNRTARAGAGIGVQGAFTMKRGAVRNNTAAGTSSTGGGIYIESREPVAIDGGEISGNTAAAGGGVDISGGSRVTMTGGSITGNTATRLAGGVLVQKGAVFTQRGGTVRGNRAPSTTKADTWDILRMN